METLEEIERSKKSQYFKDLQMIEYRRKYLNFAKRLNSKVKRIMRTRKNMFFKTFYDWDRERRFQFKLKILNTKIINKMLRNIVRSKLEQSFELILRHKRDVELEVTPEVEESP